MTLAGNLQLPASDALMAYLRIKNIANMLQPLKIQYTSLLLPISGPIEKMKAGTVRLFREAVHRAGAISSKLSRDSMLYASGTPGPCQWVLSYGRQASYLLPDSNVATVARALALQRPIHVTSILHS